MKPEKSWLIGAALVIGLGVVLAEHISAPSHPSATTIPPTVSSRPGYEAARAEWQLAAFVSGSAEQGVPIVHAMEDLNLGFNIDRGSVGYARAVGYLKSLLGLPDAMLTAPQAKLYKADFKALDKFFDTPGL